MGSREPKHLSCPTHGAVWGTIYADGAVDYDCGCHAAPTPPAPATRLRLDDGKRCTGACGGSPDNPCSTGCLDPAADAGAEGRAAIEREMAETMRVNAKDANRESAPASGEAMRHAAAEIARAGAVAAYEAMAAAPRDGAQQYTRADVNEAIGLVLDGCEAQIRAIQIDAAKGGARG